MKVTVVHVDSYAYMIDNVVLLITGTLHERDTHELLERCHPLGVFDTMPALCVATNVEELYQSVLVETPLGTCRHSSIHFTHSHLFLQPHTSVNASQHRTSTISTSKSSETPFTRLTSKISTASAQH